MEVKQQNRVFKKEKAYLNRVLNKNQKKNQKKLPKRKQK